MSGWTAVSLLFLAALVPCAPVCLRGDAADRLAGLEMAAVVTTLALLSLAQAAARPAFVEVGLAAAILSFGGGMVFARFLERWL